MQQWCLDWMRIFFPSDTRQSFESHNKVDFHVESLSLGSLFTMNENFHKKSFHIQHIPLNPTEISFYLSKKIWADAHKLLFQFHLCIHDIIAQISVSEWMRKDLWNKKSFSCTWTNDDYTWWKMISWRIIDLDWVFGVLVVVCGGIGRTFGTFALILDFFYFCTMRFLEWF